LASVNVKVSDLEFEPQGLENLQDLSDLAGWLALLEINNEAQTRATGHRQILLGDLQLSAPCANSGAKLLWILNIHVTDREYTAPWNARQVEYYRSGTFCCTRVFLA